MERSVTLLEVISKDLYLQTIKLLQDVQLASSPFAEFKLILEQT